MKEKITFKNYYLETKGVFTFIGNIDLFYVSSKWGLKIQPQYYFKNEISKTLKIDAKLIKHNFTSFNDFYKSGSIYFEIKGTSKLIRISDHWSKSNLKYVNECGDIRSCWWELNMKNKNQFNKTQYQIGIIDLRKLEKYEK